jgi:hypothetical protein
VLLPPLPLAGGCACAAVRYQITSAPLTFYLCHCTECQRQTGSAFGESLRIRVDALQVFGHVRLIERIAASGTRRQGWFCPVCGVRLWHAASGSDEINIKAGTLDDISWLQPAGHIWVRSAQSWIRFGTGDLTYDGQPEIGYLRLKARWQEMTSVNA